MAIPAKIAIRQDNMKTGENKTAYIAEVPGYDHLNEFLTSLEQKFDTIGQVWEHIQNAANAGGAENLQNFIDGEFLDTDTSGNRVKGMLIIETAPSGSSKKSLTSKFNKLVAEGKYKPNHFDIFVEDELEGYNVGDAGKFQAILETKPGR